MVALTISLKIIHVKKENSNSASTNPGYINKSGYDNWAIFCSQNSIVRNIKGAKNTLVNQTLKLYFNNDMII
ncbi:MAG: hypothetical protein NVSMB24_25020 [Mucilaginibacter sp.]